MTEPQLAAHTLKLVSAPPGHPVEGQVGTYFGSCRPFHPVRLSGADEENAFAFPSEILARRYAVVLLMAHSLSYLPVPANGRESTGFDPADRACRRCGCTEAFGCPTRCSWVEHDLCSACTGPDLPESWALFRSPADYPGMFVARRLIAGTPTTNVLTGISAAAISSQLPAGSVWLPRSKGDVSSLVGTWMF